eukprot:XP_011435800.2 PREDICTED: tight junction protein ZO-1 isoform X2 [Crassostrea gigas]
MAGKQGVTRLLTRHRASLVRDLDTNKILPHLVAKEVISTSEERQVLDVSDPRERTEVLLDIVGKRGLGAFHDFCSCLEKVAPHLLTGFLLEHSGSLSPNGEEKKPTQALQLSLELALNERDLMLRENAKAVEERDQAIRQLELLKSERESAFSLEKPSKNTNTKSSELSPPAHRKSQRLLDKFREMEPETDQEDGFVKAPTKVKGLDNVTWETHNVTLRRVPGFGFGIAVSGGRDNPHFANGDPSIAISDVLTAGPAEGKLLINDRVMSVNGIPLENVDHKQAIAVLKDSGNKVNLVIRRRVLVPTYTDTENTPLKITLSRKNRREDFGVVLGCKYFIKEITGNSIAAQDGGLKEGDVVLKINSTAIENLSMVDAKKLIEKTKDKLQLFIAKTRYEDRGPANKAQDDEYSLGYGTLQGTLQNKRSDIDNVNIYRPSLSSPEEEIYKGHHNYQEIPPGSYPNSEHARYDGRYIYDHEAPPRPPLPDETDAPPRPPSPGKELLRPDDFYSPRSPRSPHPPHSPLGDGYLSDHGRMDPHGQRRHDERYVGKRKDIVLDPRFVYFEKEPEFGLGLRLAGGNATGIFIASVQPGSGAEAVGLTEGDQILKANDVEIPGMTREDAVTYLTSLEGRVSMVVQYKREEYDRIISSHEAGDSFFIRTHFEYQAKDMGELSFTIGDIFHIKDTLFRGVVGSWLAMRIGRNNQETQKGFIPNRNSAEQIFLSTTHTEAEKENTPTKSRSLLFKRKAARRSKSLGKDHWEDVIFSNLTTKFPAYERVTLRDTGFVRPVVIFGALADVAREKLLQDFPDKFESPQTDASSQGGNDQRKSGIIRLGAIKEIINKRKHCLLDVTPHNVDKLNYAQYYPIVVFLKAENKNIVKDCRAKFAKGSTKNHKKLFEQSQKLEKLYPHLFTATISHNNTEVWYSRLQEMIHLQQEQQIWMSEHKPEDNVNDDFLFPMGSRASYSPAQDTEPGNTPKTHPDDFDASPKHKKRLVRSSSDPSINTTDRVPGIPPYPAPPSYHRSPGSPNRKLMDDRRYVDFDRQSEDRYYPSYYASESLPHGQFPHTRSIEPYATITHHERLRSKIPEDGQWYNPAYDDRGPQKFNPEYHRSEPDLGRHVNHNRPSTASLPPPQPHQTHDPGQGQPPHPPHHSQPFQENASSYSSDSYSRYTSNPVNRHDDSKLREKFGSLAVAAKGERSIGHDPYRFTRSTANPVNTANIDKSKLSDLSARYRKDEHPPTRKQSLPSPVISPSVNQPPASSAPPHHAPLQQDGAPPRVKKEPPPVPVKTYHLRDRGIEPDDLKIRNYENSNRAYNYADPSSYSGPDQKHHYNEQNENPYDYVAPRQNSAPRSRTSPNQNAVYARPYASPDRHSREGSYDRGRSFMNQIYMDTEQLQKLRARQENHPPTSNHGNREVMGARDSGYPGPERPRETEELIGRSISSEGISGNGTSFSSYKNLITPGFYGAIKPFHSIRDDPGDHSRAVNHEASDRERSSHEDSSDHGSAFEAYRKPAMSTFGKVPAGKGFEPSKHIRTSSPKPDSATVSNHYDDTHVTHHVSAPESGDSDTVPKQPLDENEANHPVEGSQPRQEGTSEVLERSASDWPDNKGETDNKRQNYREEETKISSVNQLEGKWKMGKMQNYGGKDMRVSSVDEPDGKWKADQTPTYLGNGMRVSSVDEPESKWNINNMHNYGEKAVRVSSVDGPDGKWKTGEKMEDSAYDSEEFSPTGSTGFPTYDRTEKIKVDMDDAHSSDYSHEWHRENLPKYPSASTHLARTSDITNNAFDNDDDDSDDNKEEKEMDKEMKKNVKDSIDLSPPLKRDDLAPAQNGKKHQIGNEKDSKTKDNDNARMAGDPVPEKGGQGAIPSNHITNSSSRLSTTHDRKPEGTEEKAIPPASVFNFPKMRLDRYKLGDDKKVSPTSNRLDRYRGLLGTHGRMSSYEKSSSEDVRAGGPEKGEKEIHEQKSPENIQNSVKGNDKIKNNETERKQGGDVQNSSLGVHGIPSNGLQRNGNEDEVGGGLVKSPSSNTLVEDDDDSSTASEGSVIRSPSIDSLVESKEELKKPQLETRKSQNLPENSSNIRKVTNEEDKDKNEEKLPEKLENGDARSKEFDKGGSKGLSVPIKLQAAGNADNSNVSLKKSTVETADKKAQSKPNTNNGIDREVMEILDYDRMYDQPSVGHSLIRGISHESPTNEPKSSEVRQNPQVINGRSERRNQDFRKSQENRREPHGYVRRDQSAERVRVSVKSDKQGYEVTQEKQTIYRTYRRTSGITKRNVLAYNKDIKETCVDDIYDDDDVKVTNDKNKPKTTCKTVFSNHNGQGDPDLADGPAASDEEPFAVNLRQLKLESLNIGSDNGQLIEGNHTVVATARGVFDHQGGVLESPETGVSIVIPKGAIPEGVSQEIYFKVCKDNNILPPLDKDKGETLLSPLVMCGPHGLKFLLPVELRLPHCASVNPDSWSFALKSSDSPTGHPTQWQNMTLAGMDGVAQGRVGKNSVSVLVDHF